MKKKNARAGEIPLSTLPEAEALENFDYANGHLSSVRQEKDRQVVQIESRLIALPLDLDLAGYTGKQICLTRCDGKFLIRLAGAKAIWFIPCYQSCPRHEGDPNRPVVMAGQSFSERRQHENTHRNLQSKNRRSGNQRIPIYR
jgi:hypothetical protein